MKIKYDVVSHVGAVRDNNEDMACVFGAKIRDDAQRSMVPLRGGVRFGAVVADGMGGYGGGEIASEMAVDSFDRFLLALPDGLDTLDVVMAVKRWGSQINNEIRSKGAADSMLANMGTTLTGVFTYGDDEFLVNSGDSRVYRFRDGFLRQLTVDHSERERCKDYTLPSNLIYNALGIEDAFVDVTSFNASFPMLDGDVYLICSDGLCDMVSDDRISAILEQKGNAQMLVDAAIEAGGRDNCTVILLQVTMPEERPEEMEESHTLQESDVTEDVMPPAIPREIIEEMAQKAGEIGVATAHPTPLPPPPPPVPQHVPSIIPLDEGKPCYDEEGNKVHLPPAPPVSEEKQDGTFSRFRSFFKKGT